MDKGQFAANTKLDRSSAGYKALIEKRSYTGPASGRPKRDEDIAALARAHTEDAIAVLASIAENPKANYNARISAANSLLDRGHGKPPQAVAVKTESNNDTFVRLWRYLTVGEMVAEPKDVTD